MTITSFSLDSVENQKVGRSCVTRKCVWISILAVSVAIACLCIIVTSLSGFISKGSEEETLRPPDPIIEPPPSPSELHTFKRAAVCADAAPCSKIGRDIFVNNGTAVDAAIATLFCNGIVNMQSMGLGGGFLMTIYIREEGKAYSLNAREAAPLASTQDMYIDNPQAARKGMKASGVPGELRGYWAAHKRFGRLPWANLIKPSIELCERGYNMSKAQWDALHTNDDIKKDTVLSEMFVDPTSGKYKRGGSVIKPTVYCDTLRKIAERGGDDLYNGSLAEDFVQDIQKMGGLITKKDMEQYQAVWQESSTVYLPDNTTIYAAPPPGSGVLLGFILNVLHGFNLTRKDISTPEKTIATYHKIIETFKYAYARRTQLGDPAFNNFTELLKNLVSNEYAEEIRKKIDETKTYGDPAHYGAEFYTGANHGTAHVSVLAENGDAVSVTSTVNLYFGNGVTSPSTGIILNSGMDDFSSSFLNYFGLPGSPANAIEPGKRPLSSMSPAVITDPSGDVKMVIGASGGTKITTAMALVIMRTLWLEQTIKQAVDAARIHHQVFPMEISYEYGIPEGIVSGLKALGHNMTRYRERGSIICALFKTKDFIYANADYRKGGDVYGLD